MDVILNNGQSIQIRWRIYEGTNKVSPDFRHVDMRVFLVGNEEKYDMDYTVVDMGNGVKELVVNVLSDELVTGTYDIKAIWYKNRFAIERNPKYYQFLVWSIRKGIFAITDSSEEQIGNGPFAYTVSSYVEPIGSDGLSSYEIALFRGFTDAKSEGEWAYKEVERERNEATRAEAEAKRVSNESEREKQEAIRVRQELHREEAEQRREELFSEIESEMLSTFEENEANRQSVFEANEANREKNEDERQANETERDKKVEDALADIRASRPITSDEVTHFKVLTEEEYDALIVANEVRSDWVYLIT